jgi:thiamine pyrophosphate-dependent acetolactate synthase large subunit-like protein
MQIRWTLKMIKGSDLLVEALANEGVDRIFGIPGEENLDVVESLRKTRQSNSFSRDTSRQPLSW